MSKKSRYLILIIVLAIIAVVFVVLLKNQLDKSPSNDRISQSVALATSPINGQVVGEEMPKTNPFDTSVNPFDSYQNPFKD